MRRYNRCVRELLSAMGADMFLLVSWIGFSRNTAPLSQLGIGLFINPQMMGVQCFGRMLGIAGIITVCLVDGPHVMVPLTLQLLQYSVLHYAG